MRSPAAAFDLRAALSDEIRAAIEELGAARLKAKAVHRCRVRLKRARALARVGRSCAPGLSAVFNESARAVMHELSHARDLAALSAAARTAARKARKKQASALLAVADTFAGQEQELPALDRDTVGAALRDLLAMAQVWPEASPRQIEKGAERIVQRARRARRRGRASTIAARRHEWRKREKDRLYAAILLGGAWPASAKRRLARNQRLGDALGTERDALLLVVRLQQEPDLAGGSDNARRARKGLARRLKRLGHRADVIGDALHEGGA